MVRYMEVKASLEAPHHTLTPTLFTFYHISVTISGLLTNLLNESSKVYSTHYIWQKGDNILELERFNTLQYDSCGHKAILKEFFQEYVTNSTLIVTDLHHLMI